MKFTIATLLCIFSLTTSAAVLGNKIPRFTALDTIHSWKGKMPNTDAMLEKILSVVLIRNSLNKQIGTGILIKPNRVLSVASSFLVFMQYFNYAGLNVLTPDEVAKPVKFIEIHDSIKSKLSLEKYNIAVITIQKTFGASTFYNIHGDLLLPHDSRQGMHFIRYTCLQKREKNDAQVVDHSFCATLEQDTSIRDSTLCVRLQKQSSEYALSEVNLGSVVFAHSGQIVGVVSKIFTDMDDKLFLCTLVFEPMIYNFISAAEIRKEPVLELMRYDLSVLAKLLL